MILEGFILIRNIMDEKKRRLFLSVGTRSASYYIERWLGFLRELNFACIPKYCIDCEYLRDSNLNPYKSRLS